MYLNDLERDREYVRWDRSVMDLLRVFPGMLPKVRRNLFNVVCVIDPATPKGLGSVSCPSAPPSSLIHTLLPLSRRGSLKPRLNASLTRSVNGSVSRGRKIAAEVVALPSTSAEVYIPYSPPLSCSTADIE